MAENSAISWTDHTFNPWIGCTKVSDGCKNCYAERDFDKRRHVVEWGPGKPRHRTVASNWRKPRIWNAKAEKAGTRPRVFCASLADWLDPEVPVAWLADLLALIQETPHLDWLLLTKRPELWRQRLAHVFGVELSENRGAERGRLQLAWDWFHAKNAPANVWIGTTVENQKATARIPHLLRIPARVRFLSCEPLLGPIDLRAVARPDDAYMNTLGHTSVITTIEEPDDYLYWSKKGIHWVICGGESGPNARPMHPDWARGLRDQCVAAGVPFHFKEWGEWAPGECTPGAQTQTQTGAWLYESSWNFQPVTVKQSEEMHCDDEPDVWRFGVMAAGRLLDGREWNELPEVAR